MTLGVYTSRSFIDCSLFQMGGFVVARFLLTSASHGPSAIAELLVLLWVMTATKSTKLGSRYLGEGSLEWDEILQVARGELVYPTTQTGDLCARGSPLGAKVLKGVKKICNDFLEGGFIYLYEIWHGGGGALGGSKSQAILMNFGSFFQEHKFSIAVISHIF